MTLVKYISTNDINTLNIHMCGKFAESSKEISQIFAAVGNPYLVRKERELKYTILIGTLP